MKFNKIAFIGTGVMGAPMASHIAKAGYQVHVYNRTYEKAARLEPLVTAHQTLESCVQDADVIFSIVGYPKDVEEIYEVIMKTAKKGAILADMTTSSPKLAEILGEKAKQQGLYMLDSPVTGGDLGAIKGTLSIMVGGDKEKYEAIKPLLETMGQTINYCGTNGQGQRAKLANQISVAAGLAGIAESLSFAKENKLEQKVILDIITGGSANSWQASNNGQKMIDKDFKPGFFLKHLVKDLHLALEEKGDLDLPMLKTITNIYDQLLEDGLGDQGTQAIIEYYQK